MAADSQLQALGGAEKAAMLIMALGEDGAAQLFAMMDESEIRAVSRHMATLGPALARTIEARRSSEGRAERALRRAMWSSAGRLGTMNEGSSMGLHA